MKVVQMSGWPNFRGTRLYGKYSLKFRPGYRENILKSAYFDIQFHKIVLNLHIYFIFIWESQNQDPRLGESERLWHPWPGIFLGNADPQLGKISSKSTRLSRSYVPPSNGDFPSRVVLKQVTESSQQWTSRLWKVKTIKLVHTSLCVKSLSRSSRPASWLSRKIPAAFKRQKPDNEIPSLMSLNLQKRNYVAKSSKPTARKPGNANKATSRQPPNKATTISLPSSS